MAAGNEKSVMSSRAPKPVGPYPHARRSGPFLFLSGIGPRQVGSDEIPGVECDASGAIVRHDVAVQTRACIENIKAVLEDAGSSLARVVDVTVYLIDIERDFDAFNAVYREYFGEIRPTRTTVGVVALPTPIAVEMKVIAEARE